MKDVQTNLKQGRKPQDVKSRRFLHLTNFMEMCVPTTINRTSVLYCKTKRIFYFSITG